MKKSLFTVLFVLLSVVATFAMPLPSSYELINANPVWKDAPDFTANNPDKFGFYIWANDDSRRSWSIRWSSLAVDGNGATEFQPTIYLTDNVFDEVLKVKFEGNDKIVDQGPNKIEVTAYTGDEGDWAYFDGLDFTISGDVMPSYLGFDLEINDWPAFAENIYVGKSFVNPLSDDFKIAAPVPEPGTLLLLGSGLIGLAYLKRRKS